MTAGILHREFVEVRAYRDGAVVVRELCGDPAEGRDLINGWRAVPGLEWEMRPVDADWSDRDAGLDPEERCLHEGDRAVAR